MWLGTLVVHMAQEGLMEMMVVTAQSLRLQVQF
jgi:hypothetical protein